MAIFTLLLFLLFPLAPLQLPRLENVASSPAQPYPCMVELIFTGGEPGLVVWCDGGLTAP
jgi:hypothetical protein